MRRIQAFCVSSKVSGGELYTLELLHELKRLGWECSLTTGNNHMLSDRAIALGINARVSKLGPKLGKRTALRVVGTLPMQLLRFRAELRMGGNAILLLQYKLEQLLFALVGWRREAVVLEHGPVPSLITRIPPIRYLYVKALKRSGLVLAASRPAQESLNALGIDSSLLLAGMDRHRIQEALENLPDKRRRLEELTGATCIGVYAGRIVANKGVIDSALLVSQVEDLGLVLFGEGPEVESVRALTRQMPSVHYAGPVEDALNYIAAADFGILLTSDPGEGRPLFGVECVSVGTPLIAAPGSAAINGLVEEFGPTNIRVLSTISKSELVRQLDRGTGESPPLRDWAETAAEFIELLNGSGLSRGD